MSHPADTDTDIWVSWSQYHRLIENLAMVIDDSGWSFDQIICVARGGLRVGDVLSRLYRVPLAVLSASSYQDHSGREQGQLDISPEISMATGQPSGSVLLVDDMVDTGLTFAQVHAHLLKRYPAIQEIRTGVLWWKAHSVIKPDFYARYLEGSPWIHQPFEVYDNLSLQALKETR